MNLALASVVAALIQVGGEPLRPGLMQGSAVVPLERAAGGDTPVLSFRTAAGPGDGAVVRLLVDTGASSTLVTAALVRRLGVASTPIPPAQFGLAGAGEDCGELGPRRAVLPVLQLAGEGGRVEVRGGEVLVLEADGLPPGVDGVIGAPLLRQLPLWVDPGANRLALGARALQAGERLAAADPVAPAALTLRWRAGVPLVPLTTPAGPVSALADTGAEGLFITPALAGRLPATAPPTPVGILGFCGLQPAQRLSLTGISFSGRAPRGPLEAIVTANPVFAAVGAEAIVGQELLRHHRQLWRLDREPPTLQLW
ncbi:MAG: aspartyl protease family protein [Cyanobacteria bacterium J06638_7]